MISYQKYISKDVLSYKSKIVKLKKAILLPAHQVPRVESNIIPLFAKFY